MTWSSQPGGAFDTSAVAVSESGYVLCERADLGPSRTRVYSSRVHPATTGWSLEQALLAHTPAFDDSFAGGLAMVGQDTIAAGTLRPSHAVTNDDWGFTWSLTTQAFSASQASYLAVPQHTSVLAINAMGLLAGLYRAPFSSGIRWDGVPMTSPSVLSPIAGYPSSLALSLNVHALAVGHSGTGTPRQATAWLPSSGTARALDWLDPAYPRSKAYGVNRSGHAAGYSDMDDPNSLYATDRRAVLWTSLSPTDLGVLAAVPPTQTFLHSASAAYAISDGIPGVLAEEVVGTSWDNSGSTQGDTRAFVWDATNGMRDLNLLISSYQGWGPNPNVTIQEAAGINSLGEIAAVAFVHSSGSYNAVLLTPDLATPRLGRLQAPFVGAATTMHGLGFTPGALLTLSYDFGTGVHSMPNCPGQSMQLDPVHSPVLATAVADQRGRVEFLFTVPAVDFSTGVFLQAWDPGGCDLSNLVTEIIQ